MVDLQDRQVEAPTVLRHGQVDPVLMNILPLQCQSLRLPEAREKKKFIEDGVDGGNALIVCRQPTKSVIKLEQPVSSILKLQQLPHRRRNGDQIRM